MAKSNGGSNWISFGVAILAVGLFLGWLATREPPQTVAVVEPGDTADANAVPDSTLNVDVADARVLEGEAMEYSARLDEVEGELVRINDVAVAGNISDELFWIQLPSGDQYLVKLDESVTRSERPSGDVDVVGVVQPKNDAVLDGWMEAGVLENDDQRTQVQFGLTYLNALRIRPASN